MKQLLTFTLSVILAIASVSVHAETSEEMQARFEKVRKECAAQADKELDFYNPHFLVREKCRRIDSLHHDLIQCIRERNRLRLAVGCDHHWIESRQGVKFCERCGIYAIQHINGMWLLVPREGTWIGAEPKDYPEDYGLK